MALPDTSLILTRNAYSWPYPESLAKEWDELANQVGATPYLRPGWLAAWWRAFGSGTLDVHTLRRNGTLVGVLPISWRHGVCRSATNFHTPRSGLLAADWNAASALARAFFMQKPFRVSIAALDPQGTSIQACLREAEQAGYRAITRPFQRSPYLDINDDWSEYESRLSRSLVSDLRRARRRLERQGRVNVEFAHGHERLDELLNEAYDVEAYGWKGTRATAIRSRPETHQFYTEIAHWAATRNMLRLIFLRLDQRPIAMYYALEDQGVCYLLKGGYDPAYRRFSPGKLLMHATIAHCFSSGLSGIEFHGDAEPYKFNWTSSVHEQKRFDAFSGSPAGQLAWSAIAYGRPAARRMFGRLTAWRRAKA